MIEKTIKKLIELKKTISTMESCSGGALANAITNIPDASKILLIHIQFIVCKLLMK